MHYYVIYMYMYMYMYVYTCALIIYLNYTGVQVKPVVKFASVGVQCSLECPQSAIATRDIGVQCMLPVGPKLPINFFQQCSSPIPSDSSQSDFQVTDHNTSVFTPHDDLSS